MVKYVYTLGASGERIKVEELDSTVEYTYDELYRLTSETITEGKKVTTYTYAYDSVSNRTLKTVNGDETVYTYNSLNQLISENDTTYEYDNAGNLVRVIGSGKSALYEYNSENKLVKATVQQGNTVVVEEYTYDYEGNRTSKATTTSGGNVEYIQYLNDNSSLTNVIVEIGSENVYYTVGADLISQEVDGEVYVYLYDGHGTVRALADEDGKVTDTYSYDAFGNLIDSTGDTENSYLYCGEQYDETTGLYYLRARYMDTSTGRFISMDTYQGTTADPISLHKYLYANSNPVMYTDPSGYTTYAEKQVTVATIAILIKDSFVQVSAAIATGMKIIATITTVIAVGLYTYLIVDYILEHINDIASGATTSADVNAEVRDEAVESSTDGAGAGSGGAAPDPDDDDLQRLIRSAIKHSKTILEHFDKLSKYCKDPYSGDNLGKLATATEWVRQQMIDGRITSLLNKQLANQINNLNQVIEEIIETLKNM